MPDDPLRRDYPPIPPKPPPFDLDALRRIERPAPRRLRWRRGRGMPQLEDARPTVTTPRASVVLLALIPDPEQCNALRSAVAAAGAPYEVPPRLTLRNGLSIQDETAWRPAVHEVTSHWRPFTVRLRPPEVVDDRLVSIAPVGDAVSDLQHAIGAALSKAGFVARTGDVSAPVVPLAGTFTGLNRVQLHDLANAVRDGLAFPMDFRATTLYAVAEAAVEDDLPVDAFPFAG
jgi:hypothetical protein